MRQRRSCRRDSRDVRVHTPRRCPAVQEWAKGFDPYRHSGDNTIHLTYWMMRTDVTCNSQRHNGRPPCCTAICTTTTCSATRNADGSRSTRRELLEKLNTRSALSFGIPSKRRISSRHRRPSRSVFTVSSERCGSMRNASSNGRSLKRFCPRFGPLKTDSPSVDAQSPVLTLAKTLQAVLS